MKKQIILLTLLTISVCITAQNKNNKPLAKSNVKWLFKVGIMSTTLNAPSVNSKIGFQLGITGDFPLSEDTYFNTGLVYQDKGYSFSGGSISLSYLEIPVTWVSKLNAVWLGAGLYAGIPVKTYTSFKNADIGGRVLAAVPFGAEKKTAISAEFTYSFLAINPYGSARHVGIGINLLQYF